MHAGPDVRLLVTTCDLSSCFNRALYLDMALKDLGGKVMLDEQPPVVLLAGIDPCAVDVRNGDSRERHTCLTCRKSLNPITRCMREKGCTILVAH